MTPQDITKLKENFEPIAKYFQLANRLMLLESEKTSGVGAFMKGYNGEAIRQEMNDSFIDVQKNVMRLEFMIDFWEEQMKQMANEDRLKQLNDSLNS